MMTKARYAIVVLVGLVFLLFFWVNGWVEMVVETDVSRISLIIVAWTLFTLYRGFNRAVAIDKILTSSKLLGGNRQDQELMFERIMAPMHFVKRKVVLLGLIGTVIGFIIVMSPINIEDITNIEKLPQLFVNMFSGLGVALYTTLAGAMAALWIGAGNQVLHSGVLEVLNKCHESK